MTRTLEAIAADIESLKRPTHPGVVVAMTPLALTRWKIQIATWRLEHPHGDARYLELLEEERSLLLAKQEARQRENILRSSGVPSRTLAALDNLQENAATRLAREFSASDFQWLVLVGKTGIGKSVAAALVCDIGSRLGRVQWVSAAECLDALQRFDAASLAAELRRVPLLAVDDVGTEGRIEPLQALLTARHDDDRRTVLTSNLTAISLRERLGLRVADRIRSSALVLRAPDALSMRVVPDRRQMRQDEPTATDAQSTEPRQISTNDV